MYSNLSESEIDLLSSLQREGGSAFNNDLSDSRIDFEKLGNPGLRFGADHSIEHIPHSSQLMAARVQEATYEGYDDSDDSSDGEGHQVVTEPVIMFKKRIEAIEAKARDLEQRIAESSKYKELDSFFQGSMSPGPSTIKEKMEKISTPTGKNLA